MEDEVIKTDPVVNSSPFVGDYEFWKFNENYMCFLPHLTELEDMFFNREYNIIHNQFEQLLKKYTAIVSDRLSKEETERVINQAFEEAKATTLSVKEFVVLCIRHRVNIDEIYGMLDKLD